MMHTSTPKRSDRDSNVGRTRILGIFTTPVTTIAMGLLAATWSPPPAAGQFDAGGGGTIRLRAESVGGGGLLGQGECSSGVDDDQPSGFAACELPGDPRFSASGQTALTLSTTTGASSASVSLQATGTGAVHAVDETEFPGGRVESEVSATFSIGFVVEDGQAFTIALNPIPQPLFEAQIDVELDRDSAEIGGITFDTYGTNDVDINTLPTSGGPGSYVLRGRVSVRALAGVAVPPGQTNPTGTLNLGVTVTVSGAAQVGQDFHWSNATGGAYSEPPKWDPQNGAPPRHDGQRSDNAIFGPLIDPAGNPVTSYVVSATGATAGRFIVDQITLNLDGTAQVFGSSSVEPSLSIIRAGTLLLDNGARLNAVHGSVGFNPSSGFSGQSELQIFGPGSDAAFGGRLIVGEFADGGLTILDGGTLGCAEAIVGDIATGQVSLRGAGSRWDADSLTIGAVSAAGTVEVREEAKLEIVDKLIVGDLSTGTLRLIDGATAKAAEVVLGKQSNGVSRGDGTIELKVENGGTAPQLEVNGLLQVGDGGDGTLIIADGGTVQARKLDFPNSSTLTAFGTGHVIVRGTAASGSPSDLTVTDPVQLDFGLLEVLDGGFANFAEATVGDAANTEVTVRGRADANDPATAATLAAGRLRVGVGALGKLTVETGGKVICSELEVSELFNNGVGEVNVNGGEIDVSGTLKAFGDSDPGSNIVVENGGKVSAGALRLGDDASNERAEIVVRNTGGGRPSTIRIRGECLVGEAGGGFLAIENGAVAAALIDAKVGDSPSGGEGLVEIGADGFFAVSGNLDVGGASPGTIRLLAESSRVGAFGGGTVVNAGGRVEGIGTFEGVRIVNPGGFVSPGLSPGTLTIDGDYEQGDGGTLLIEVAGLEEGEFDVLHITGNATLAGKVDLKFIDGFVPQAGDSVDFVQVDGTITGMLTGVSVIEAVDGTAQAEVKWEVTADGTCRMTVTSITPADALENPLADCGTGLCGAGVVPLMPLTLIGLATLKASRRRHLNGKQGELASLTITCRRDARKLAGGSGVVPATGRQLRY